MALTPNKIPKVVASDFFKDLTIIPGKEDIARKLNENAIKESIKNIVLTNKGERPFQPAFGCDLDKLLFEGATPQTYDLIKTVVTDAIETFEPRCDLLGVDVLGDIDSNQVYVTILFRIINTDNPVSFNILLDRTR
jgi:phage baseplate assembly protein W